MSLAKFFITGALLAVFFQSHISEAKEIAIRSSDGIAFTMDVNPQDSFQEVISQIGLCLGETNDGDFCLDYKGTPVKFYAGDSQEPIRDYHIPLTKEEKENITYIVTTLGTQPWPKVIPKQGSLKKAGDKIYHIHPLRMLTHVFTVEELKAAMASLRGKVFVWKPFKDGLYKTLTLENKLNNLKLEYIQDFARAIKVDLQAILPFFEEDDWDGLIKTLIQKVPRAGEPGRYDM
jgi:hypothetical protein